MHVITQAYFEIIQHVLNPNLHTLDLKRKCTHWFKTVTQNVF